jgi:SAM-dependent methyltransferase
MSADREFARNRLAVDDERWRRAQAWELAFWQRDQKRPLYKRLILGVLGPLLAATGSRKATGDDWNLWWREQFDGYGFLPHDVGDYIELGCGPYTNTRLILEGRTAKRVVCSDPLAQDYLGFHNRWLAHAHRAGTVEVDAHPIEESPFPPGSFDVVVLINVLDHVRDAARCLDVATALLRPGGFFVFGQDVADPASVGRSDYEWFEEGHPLRLSLEDVAPWLERFEPLVHNVVPPRDPRLQTGVLAFAGTRR